MKRLQRWVVCAAAVAFVGCSGDDGAEGPAGAAGAAGAAGVSTLATTTSLAEGDSDCPGGGLRLDLGVDDNGDGTLDAAEIDSTQLVCNGVTPATALTRSSELGQGDANCVLGGTQIDAGIDDGSGDGTAGDGILQDGEVTSTAYACNNSASNVGSFEPPGGDAGTYSINLRGGSSSAAGSSGGEGGDLDTYLDYGSAGGHIKLFRTGDVDASFAFPERPDSFDFGPTPLEVPAGTTLRVRPVVALADAVDSNGNALTAGDVVILEDCFNFLGLFIWDSTTETTRVTGVHVRATGVLTFDDDDNCDRRIVSIERAFLNEGTITAAVDDATGDTMSLDLNVGSFYSTADSLVDLSGADGDATTVGSNGGDFDIEATQNSYFGALLVQGVIDTHGGDGEVGGNGGSIDLEAEGHLYNAAALRAYGGDALELDFSIDGDSAGGTGGDIDLQANYASLFNSGELSSYGGRGSQTGGDAGDIQLSGGDDDVGDLHNSGALLAYGGDADPSCGDGTCAGGDGNSIELEGMNVVSNATLATYGGDGASGFGGNGGYIDFMAEYGQNDNTVSNDNIPGGAITISGNLDLHGGDGAAGGGSAQYVEMEGNPDYVPFGQEIVLMGYGGGIDTRGGDGAADGGGGGEIYLYMNDPSENNNGDYRPAGSIINYVAINTSGGSASEVTGFGGSAGDVQFETYDESEGFGTFGSEVVHSFGDVIANGGVGGAGGGSGGYVFMFGMDGLVNGAAITASGGDASAPDGFGGETEETSEAGDDFSITLIADRGPVVNSGALTCNGGNATAATGTGSGGQSYGIQLEGPSVENSGDLTANGGDSNTTTGFGGSADTVVIQSYAGHSVNTGALSANGGAGASGQAGTDGLTVIDGNLL